MIILKLIFNMHFYKYYFEIIIIDFNEIYLIKYSF